MTGGEAEIRSLLPRLDAALAHEVARFRTRYQLSLDEFRGVYVSDAQVDALLAKEVAASALALPEPAEGPRWQALTRKLQLPRLAKDILILALAPEIDTKYGPIYAYLNDDAAFRAWSRGARTSSPGARDRRAFGAARSRRIHRRRR